MLSNKKERSSTLEIIIPLVVVIVGTGVCWATDFDIWLSSWFFDPETRGWKGYQNSLIYHTYRWGPNITVLLFTGGLLVTLASYLQPRHFLKRGTALFVVLCILIGPVFLVSGVGKELWRRPRPRDIAVFGGAMRYQKVLTIKNRDYRGQSFPGGHASAAFSLVLLYFVLKKRNQGLARISLLATLGWGVWMSFVRIALGGHFFSDNLYSFAINWFVVRYLYYNWYIPYSEKLVEKRRFEASKKRYVIAGIVIVLFSGIFIFNAVARQPFETSYAPEKVSIPTAAKEIELDVDVDNGNIIVSYGNPSEITFVTFIRGKALSEVEAVRELTIDKTSTKWTVDYDVKPSSFAFKYSCYVYVYIPKNTRVDVKAFTTSGSIHRSDLLSQN